MHIRDLFSKQCCLATVGACLIGFGAMFAVFWGEFFEATLAKEMQLAPNTRVYEMWKRPPMPISFDIYFFNWTNPTAFGEDTWQKPVLQELGPYRFTEVMDKVDIEWSPHNSTVSYRKKSTYFFDAAGSKGQLNDTITTLNIIALSAAAKAMTWSYTKQRMVSMGLHSFMQAAHVTKSAGELLFDGYEDDMITTALAMPSVVAGETLEVPFDKFGWFYMRNGTSNQTGTYNINTGAADISHIGRVESWNYQTRTNYFADECGMINGSAGEFYPPHLTKERPLSFYSGDMCRTLDFDFEREQEVHGVRGYKYSGGRKTVDNGTEYPANECFSTGERVPSGVMNVTACRYGTPVFMSFPHYYAADPYYLQFVDGLRPQQDLHEFSMTMEPRTGVPLDVRARLQINMLIRPTEHIALYQHAPRMFFPVLWFEQRVAIAPEMAAEIAVVLVMPQIGYVCFAVMIVLGVVLVVWLPLVRLVLRYLRGAEKAAGGGDGGGPDVLGGKFATNLDMYKPEGSPLMGGEQRTTAVKMRPTERGTTAKGGEEV